MEITRDIILDLLPLYLAGEASDDSITAIQLFLEQDPELASVVEQVEIPRLHEVPKPLSKEVEMDAYKKANTIMAIRTIALAVIIAGTFLAVMLIVPVIYLMVR